MAQSLQTDKTVEFGAVQDAGPLARRAARHLVEVHQRGWPVNMTAFDHAEAALADIAGQLEDFGLHHNMSAPLVQALSAYLAAHSEEFAQGTLPLKIHLTVADTLPARQFEESLTRVVYFKDDTVRCEGAAGINWRITISGSAMTTNADKTDAMFAAVTEAGLWARFELPSKQQLEKWQASLSASVGAAIGAMGGAAMDSGAWRTLLEEVRASGMLTPQIETLIGAVIALQENKAGDNNVLPHADMAALLDSIASVMTQDSAGSLIPPALREAITESLVDLSSSPLVHQFLVEQGMDPARLVAPGAAPIGEQLDALVARIENLQSAAAAETNPQVKEQIDTLVAALKEQLESKLMPPEAILQALGDGLAALAAQADMPSSVFEQIGEILPDIAVIKETVTQDARPPEQVAAAHILTLMEKSDVFVEAMPPEIAALMDTIGGIDVLRDPGMRDAQTQVLAAAIKGDGAPHILQTTHAAIAALVAAEGVSALPSPVQRTLMQASSVILPAVLLRPTSAHTIMPARSVAGEKVTVQIASRQKPDIRPANENAHTHQPVSQKADAAQIKTHKANDTAIKEDAPAARKDTAKEKDQTYRAAAVVVAKEKPAGEKQTPETKITRPVCPKTGKEICPCDDHNKASGLKTKETRAQELSVLSQTMTGNKTLTETAQGDIQLTKTGKDGITTTAIFTRDEMAQSARVMDAVEARLKDKGIGEVTSTLNDINKSLDVISLKQGESMHIHFNGCCGTDKQPKGFTASEVTSDVTAYGATGDKVDSQVSAAEIDLSDLTDDAVTRDLDDSFKNAKPLKLGGLKMKL